MDGFKASHYSSAVILEYSALFGQQEIKNQHVENYQMFLFLLDGLLEARLLEYLNKEQLECNLEGFNNTIQSIFEPYSAVQNFQQILNTVPERRLILVQTFQQDPNLNIPPNLLESVMLDTKFQSFKKCFETTIQQLKASAVAQKHPAHSIKLTTSNIEQIFQNAGITHSELVQAPKFSLWSEDTFSTVHHQENIMFLLGHPHYQIDPSQDINNIKGLLILSGRVTYQHKDNPYYLPRASHFSWQENTTLALADDCITSRKDKVVEALNYHRSQIHMDPIFLAEHIRTVVGLNLWLVTPKAPEKTTPFQITIEHYDHFLAETKRAEQLKKADQQKKALLAKLEDQAKRNKEDCTCQHCFSLFTYYYPLGQSSPFKEIIPSGEMDPDLLCHICKDLLCTICKATICLEIEEITHQTCAICIKRCTCCQKILQKTEDQTLDL
jgi:hypothetical protein